MDSGSGECTDCNPGLSTREIGATADIFCVVVSPLWAMEWNSTIFGQDCEVLFKANAAPNSHMCARKELGCRNRWIPIKSQVSGNDSFQKNVPISVICDGEWIYNSPEAILKELNQSASDQEIATILLNQQGFWCNSSSKSNGSSPSEKILCRESKAEYYHKCRSSGVIFSSYESCIQVCEPLPVVINSCTAYLSPCQNLYNETVLLQKKSKFSTEFIWMEQIISDEDPVLGFQGVGQFLSRMASVDPSDYHVILLGLKESFAPPRQLQVWEHWLTDFLIRAGRNCPSFNTDYFCNICPGYQANYLVNFELANASGFSIARSLDLPGINSSLFSCCLEDQKCPGISIPIRKASQLDLEQMLIEETFPDQTYYLVPAGSFVLDLSLDGFIPKNYHFTVNHMDTNVSLVLESAIVNE